MRTSSPPSGSAARQPLPVRAVCTFALWVSMLVRPRRGRVHVMPLQPQQWLLLVAAAVAVIVLTMAFVDNPVRLWVKSMAPVSPIFHAISDSGLSAWILWPVGCLGVAAALVSAALSDRLAQAAVAAIWMRLAFIFIGVGLPGLVVTIVKRWIGRVRPSEAGPFAYEPFSWKAAYASLPSGHSTTAFAALVAIGLVLPRLRPLLWVWAIAVAVSRVAIYAHYVSDVITGAAVGALGALAIRNYFASRRLGFFVGGDGRVHALPGPSFDRLGRLARSLFGQ